MMAKKNHSRKAREKFADSLFSLSNLLFSGLLAAILLVPLGALLKALVTRGDDTTSILSAIAELPPGEAMAFVAVYVAVVGLGGFARREAMAIYSELHPDD